MTPDAKTIAIGLAITAVVVLIVLRQARKDVIAIGGAAVDAATAGAHAINPLNHDNVFSGAVNAVGGAVTMDSSFSFGGWLWDETHTAPSNVTPLQPKK